MNANEAKAAQRYLQATKNYVNFLDSLDFSKPVSSLEESREELKTQIQKDIHADLGPAKSQGLAMLEGCLERLSAKILSR